MSQEAFSLGKKRVGIYFNDGGHCMWVQQMKDAPKRDEKLLEAIRAAWATFNEVYFDKGKLAGGTKE